MSVLLAALEKCSCGETMYLAQKYRVEFHCDCEYSLVAFQPICPTVQLRSDVGPESLQIPAALIHREPPVADQEHTRSMKNR
jgi:hypothetical protein